jgi:hypothetical protein
VQFEFAGTLDVPDGRYLIRDGAADGAQTVLVIETLGAPSPPARRRRAREAEAGTDRPPLPLARATAVRAFEPFDSTEDAALWLRRSVEAEDAVDALVAEGIGLLNRALHAHGVASANPRGQEMSPERAVLVRIGYGSGEEVAAGRFSVAHDIDVSAGGSPRRRRREEELRPQERLAAVLGCREQLDACETLLLRTRADLDDGRLREAALQLQPALEALLVELDGALVDPAHVADMAMLRARREEASGASGAALHGDLDEAGERSVRELAALCERILRRRRILRG